MRFLIAVFLAVMIIGVFIFWRNTRIFHKIHTPFVKPLHKKKIPVNENLLTKNSADKLKPYLKANNYCEDYCFLINMKLPSGKKRFFIYDFKKDSVLGSGLVTHGGGSETHTDALHFSNIPNSNATSLGKYKIGNEYSGKFGLAFKLYGLESTNSKAFQRFVVLHSHACVPADDIYPSPICTSLGCPTVNPAFLTVLKKNIDKANKPVILWIYY